MGFCTSSHVLNFFVTVLYGTFILKNKIKKKSGKQIKIFVLTCRATSKSNKKTCYMVVAATHERISLANLIISS